MNRGEIWTVSGGGAYINKPRPSVIIQDNSVLRLNRAITVFLGLAASPNAAGASRRHVIGSPL
jgi:mRNA-degrading endonuclease toxin of MazEF toxin-antitoxin module